MSLRKARLISEKTQQEMADSLGISRTSYIRIERHPEKATIEMAKKISEFLGISYDDIFFA